jgi:hypothetical protein
MADDTHYTGIGRIQSSVIQGRGSAAGAPLGVSRIVAKTRWGLAFWRRVTSLIGTYHCRDPDFLITPHGLGQVWICRETIPVEAPLIIKELGRSIVLGWSHQSAQAKSVESGSLRLGRTSPPQKSNPRPRAPGPRRGNPATDRMVPPQGK